MAEKNCTTILSREELMALLVYCSVTGIFTWKVNRGRMAKAGSVAGRVNGGGYLQITIKGKKYQAHRLAWLYVYGAWPPAEIDHINRVRTDNRIENLKAATRTENNRNHGKRHDNTSGHVGVIWNKRLQKWMVQITHNGKKIHLGYYTEQGDAIAARKAGELRYWGAIRAE